MFENHQVIITSHIILFILRFFICLVSRDIAFFFYYSIQTFFQMSLPITGKSHFSILIYLQTIYTQLTLEQNYKDNICLWLTSLLEFLLHVLQNLNQTHRLSGNCASVFDIPNWPDLMSYLYVTLNKHTWLKNPVCVWKCFPLNTSFMEEFMEVYSWKWQNKEYPYHLRITLPFFKKKFKCASTDKCIFFQILQRN